MTNAEAIEHLKNITIFSYQGRYIDEARDALDMAIKALEAQELSNNSPKLDSEFGDLISRQTAIDAILAVTGNSSVRELYEHVQEHGLSEMWSGGVNAAIDIIIAVPSAQPDLSGYSSRLWKAAYERGKAEAQPEIIHCGECKHRDPEDKKCDCGHDILWQLPRDDRWYCADAERKEGEE